MTPLESAADLTESARLLAFLDSLAILGSPTHASLSCVTFPRAAEVLELWVGGRDDVYSERYPTAWGECVTAVRKDTHQALVHVYLASLPTVQL